MQKNLYSCLQAKTYLICYGPDEDAAAAATAKAEADSKAAEDAAKALESQKTLTQDQVNAILAEERRKNESKTAAHIKELETLKKSQSMSDKDRQQLQARNDEMANSLLTKEQLAQKEKERLESVHKQTVQQVTADRDLWQNRFHTSMIKTAIIGEASRAEAFDPEGLIAILGPDTRLVEELDSDGKPVDIFTPKVKFKDTDAEGRPVQLELTVQETVKRMKEIPRYGYLFKSTAAGGLGANPTPTTAGGKPDTSKMSQAQWLEYRKKQGLGRPKHGA